MSIGEIYLGLSGSEQVLTGMDRKLSVEDIKISREDRTDSGRKVRDVIATKKRITITYETIEGTDLDYILCLSDLDEELSVQLWPSGGDYLTTTPSGGDTIYEAYTVLMDPIKRDRLLLTAEDGVWGGVTIVLEEV